jgi:rubrerythrin
MADIMTLDKAIQTALDYENKVRDLYLEAVKTTGDELGKRIFGALADEEQGHVDYLVDRFDEWERTGKVATADLATDLPDVEGVKAGMKRLDQQMEGKDWGTELALLDRALKAESETGAFYKKMVAELDSDGQKLFQRFLEIEDAHYDLVQAEIDALTNTGFWFDFMEFSLEAE